MARRRSSEPVATSTGGCRSRPRPHQICSPPAWQLCMKRPEQRVRDPSTFVTGAYLTVTVGDDAREAQARQAEHIEAYFAAPNDFMRAIQARCGTSTTVRSWLGEYVDSGASHLALRIGARDDLREQVDHLRASSRTCRLQSDGKANRQVSGARASVEREPRARARPWCLARALRLGSGRGIRDLKPALPCAAHVVCRLQRYGSKRGDSADSSSPSRA
jgi:hypothetical protein